MGSNVESVQQRRSLVITLITTVQLAILAKTLELKHVIFLKTFHKMLEFILQPNYCNIYEGSFITIFSISRFI